MSSPSNAAQYYTNWAAAHFSSDPAQGDPLADPDGDGETNVVEFAFGTDPLAPGGIAGAVQPLSGGVSGTNAVFQVEILEREGHQPGVQIDLYLSADLAHWFRPWWLRTTTNSLPTDPAGSVRELFTTRLPGTNVWFVRPQVQLFEGGVENAKYYVTTNGSDSGTNGPFATLAYAVGLANPGDLIYVRGGTYHWTSKISVSRSGNPTNYIRVQAYPGESPVLDFSGQTLGTRGFEISGNWWQFYRLEIFDAGDNGMYISGKSNVVERFVIHGCRDSGIQLDGGGAYNLILNCDSYHNYDTNNRGENADGFAAKFTVGPGNVFRGCRSWENSDDGWDLWQATNTVVIENCWTWSNGIDFWPDGTTFNGDGNGFKLGGNNYPGAHRLSRGITFGNPHAGVDQNNNTLGQTVDNVTAWANAGANFNLRHGANTTPHLVRNNVSIAGGSSDIFTTGTLATNNSWQILSPAARVADVLSTDTVFALAQRRDDGGLPETPFMRPVPTGRLVDVGADLGDPIAGPAPDIGAYEAPAW